MNQNRIIKIQNKHLLSLLQEYKIFTVLFACILLSLDAHSLSGHDNTKMEPGFLLEIGVSTSVDNHAALQASGYTFVEDNVQRFLVPLEPHTTFLANLDKLESSSLPVKVLNGFIPGHMKSVGPDANHLTIIAYADTAFRRAAMAGVETIVFGSGGSRRVPDGFDHSQAFEQFVTLLKEMGPVANKYNIYIAIEPLNKGETNFINNMSEGLEIVERVGHPNIKLLCDFYHMLKEDEPAEHITNAAGYIQHVHIAEKENRTPPGVAGDDFGPYIEALRNIGYEGMIAIEARWLDDFEGLLPLAIEALRQQIE